MYSYTQTGIHNTSRQVDRKGRNSTGGGTTITTALVGEHKMKNEYINKSVQKKRRNDSEVKRLEGVRKEGRRRTKTCLFLLFETCLQKAKIALDKSVQTTVLY